MTFYKILSPVLGWWTGSGLYRCSLVPELAPYRSTTPSARARKAPKCQPYSWP